MSWSSKLPRAADALFERVQQRQYRRVAGALSAQRDDLLAKVRHHHTRPRCRIGQALVAKPFPARPLVGI